MAVPIWTIGLVLVNLSGTQNRLVRKLGKAAGSRDNNIDPDFQEEPNRSTEQRNRTLFYTDSRIRGSNARMFNLSMSSFG